MPALPQAASIGPFPYWNQILNLARLRLLDLIQTPADATTGNPPFLLDQVGGDILDNILPQTQIVANAAWVDLLLELGNLGDTLVIGDTVIPAIPVVASQDTASKCWMDWSGFFDGQNFFASPPGPALPADWISPLWLAERPNNGSGGPLFVPMYFAVDGLNPCMKIPRNGQWEWRENKLWIPGANGLIDIRARFIKRLPYFQNADLPWYDQQVPIPDCENALAWYICYEWSGARGDIDRDSCLAQAKDYVDKIYNRQARRNQQTNIRRQPRSGNRQSSGRTQVW